MVERRMLNKQKKSSWKYSPPPGPRWAFRGLGMTTDDRITNMLTAGRISTLKAFLNADFGKEGRDDRNVTVHLTDGEIVFKESRRVIGKITNRSKRLREIFLHLGHLLIENGCLPELTEERKPPRRGPQPAKPPRRRGPMFVK